jgi:hypothetical protein
LIAGICNVICLFNSRTAALGVVEIATIGVFSLHILETIVFVFSSLDHSLHICPDMSDYLFAL